MSTQPVSGPQIASQRSRFVNTLSRNRAIVTAYMVAIAMFGLTSAFSPGFASVSHTRLLLLEASFIGLVALGQTFVIIGGGIDLSIPWTLNLVATLMTTFAVGQNQPLIWVLPLVFGIAATIGLINGVGIALLGIPPIVMTLAMNVAIEGAIVVYITGAQPTLSPPIVTFLATGNVGPVPADALIWLSLTIVATIVLSLSGFGRRLYSIGTSRVVSQFSGVNVASVQIATYVISALTAAVAGVLLTGFAGTSYLGMGDPYLFASVAAVAVGGAPILGGSGNYLGTVAGACILTVLAGLLPIFNLPQGGLDIIYGVTILITVGIVTTRHRGEQA